MRTDELRVDKPTTGLHEPRVEVDQRDLGRIGLHMEHGLGHEGATDEHTEHAADEVVALPHLDAVRPPEPMQLTVGIRELRRDPGGSAAPAAPADDLGKRLVYGGGPRARTHPSEQRVGHVHRADGQHSPWVRTPPGKVEIRRVVPGQVEDSPVGDSRGQPTVRVRDLERIVDRNREGEDPPPVRPDERGRGELTADRDG